MIIEVLPNEMLFYIFSFVPIHSKFVLRHTCKFFYDFIKLTDSIDDIIKSTVLDGNLKLLNWFFHSNFIPIQMYEKIGYYAGLNNHQNIIQWCIDHQYPARLINQGLIIGGFTPIIDTLKSDDVALALKYGRTDILGFYSNDTIRTTLLSMLNPNSKAVIWCLERKIMDGILIYDDEDYIKHITVEQRNVLISKNSNFAMKIIPKYSPELVLPNITYYSSDHFVNYLLKCGTEDITRIIDIVKDKYSFTEKLIVLFNFEIINCLQKYVDYGIKNEIDIIDYLIKKNLCCLSLSILLELKKYDIVQMLVNYLKKYIPCEYDKINNHQLKYSSSVMNKKYIAFLMENPTFNVSKVDIIVSVVKLNDLELIDMVVDFYKIPITDIIDTIVCIENCNQQILQYVIDKNNGDKHVCEMSLNDYQINELLINNKYSTSFELEWFHIEYMKPTIFKQLISNGVKIKKCALEYIIRTLNVPFMMILIVCGNDWREEYGIDAMKYASDKPEYLSWLIKIGCFK